jgi:hypothetical protein
LIDNKFRMTLVNIYSGATVVYNSFIRGIKPETTRKRVKLL